MEQAARNLAKIIGKPRRPKRPVTVPPDDEDTLHGNNGTEEIDGVTEPVTEMAETEHDRPEPDAPPHRTRLLALIAELEAIAASLRDSGLTDRATLRLRGDIASRLIHAHAALAKLPAPVATGEGIVERYQRADRESRERQKPPRARRGAVRSVALPAGSPEPAKAPEQGAEIATERHAPPLSVEIAHAVEPTPTLPPAPEPLAPASPRLPV